MVTSALGTPLPRRSILQAALALFTNPPLKPGVVATAPSAVTDATTASVESSLHFRANMIARFLPISAPSSHDGAIYLSAYVRDVIEDFARRATPADAARIRGLVNERDRLHIEVLNDELRAAVNVEPWQSMDWKLVFAERLAALQDDVARELGVHPEQVYNLFEHVLALDADLGYYRRFEASLRFDESRRHTLIRSLRDDHYNPRVPPIYGTDALTVFYRNLSSFAPHVAKLWNQTTEVKTLRTESIRDQIADMFGYYFRPDPELNFEWNDVDYRGIPYGFLTERDLAPRYAVARQRLATLHPRIAALAPSRLRDAALTELNEQRAALDLELRTLPARLHALRSPYMSEDSSESPTLTMIDGAHAVTLANGTVVPWLEHLRTLGVVLHVADTLATPAEDCDARLTQPTDSTPALPAPGLGVEILTPVDTGEVFVENPLPLRQ